MKSSGRNRRSIDFATVAPWLVVALLAHVGVFLALYVWGPALGPPKEDIIAVTLEAGENPFTEPGPAQDPPTTLPPTQPDPTPPSSPTETPTNDEVLQLLTETQPPADTDAPGDLAANPQPGAAATTPADRFSNRTGTGKAEALGRYGGSPETEMAVVGGLRWLAAHQRDDGAWDRKRFDRNCPPRDRCRETAADLMALDGDPAVTGLALLAFLGAGHTHLEGDFQPEVTKGLYFLLSRQRSNGSFAIVDTLEMYNHSIATLALAEAYGMTKDSAFRTAVAAGLAHIVRAQQLGGGWDYKSDLASGRNDMSVSGWAVMALASGKAAGLSIPDQTVLGIMALMTDLTGTEGSVYYARTGDGTLITNPDGPNSPRMSPSTTAIGLLIRQLLGWQRDAPLLARQTQLILAEPPDLAKLRGGDPTNFHSDYYWYYGTLAVFNRGDDAWASWNNTLKETLLKARDQSITSRGENRHAFGSWRAFGRGWGKWGRAGSRIYSTALAVMMLESYYRFVPSYLQSSGLISRSALRSALSPGSAVTPLTTISNASNVSPDVGSPVLISLLSDPNPDLRLRAALGLAGHGSPLGEDVLRQALPGRVGGERAVIDSALNQITTINWPDTYGRVLRYDDAYGVLVFDTRGLPAYIDQPVTIARNGQAIAIARITRYLQDQRLAAAEVVQLMAGQVVGLGDEISPTPKE